MLCLYGDKYKRNIRYLRKVSDLESRIAGHEKERVTWDEITYPVGSKQRGGRLIWMRAARRVAAEEDLR